MRSTMAETTGRCEMCGCPFALTVSPLMPRKICTGCHGKLVERKCTCGGPDDGSGNCFTCGKPRR